MENTSKLHLDEGWIETFDIPTFVEVSFNEEYNIFDIQLLHVNLLSQFDFVELDISFYPISKRITSDDYEFEPFEHYIDETKANKSMYRAEQDGWEHVSWLWTSAILTWIVAKFNPNDLSQTWSIVSLVSSYYAWMKWVWPYLEWLLMNKTAKSKLQFKERYFQYTQNIGSTAEKYDNYAKKKRYRMENIRPDKIWMIIDSIREKMRLRFTKKQLLALPKDVAKVNVMNVSILPELQEEFFKEGVQIWVHIKLANRLHYFPLITTRTELIQTLECISKDWAENKIWCIYNENEWFKQWCMEMRETIAFNRIKYYKSFGKKEWQIIQYSDKKTDFPHEWPEEPAD